MAALVSPENHYLLAIDQGTTSSRAILFSADGTPRHIAQRELPQHYPHKGWVEHDPETIWNDTLAVCRETLDVAARMGGHCAAIGITNQRETTILWDRHNGKPVYPAIVWQDRRTAGFCENLKPREAWIAAKTGLLVDPYFSCSKIRWILDNVPDARARAERGELAFGTIDSFLLWRLTAGKQHATDVTNAARTGLFNIVTGTWDAELLALYDIPASLLPEVKDNVALFGHTQSELFGVSLPVGGMAGDQHAALIGQGCFEAGMMKSTYGTGCFALMTIGEQFRVSQNRLLTTPAFSIGGKITYAIEGSIFIAGAAVQWLRDNMGLIGDAGESERCAIEAGNNNGVYFIPAFTGLGAPFWRPEARAMIAGLTRDSTRNHMIRAALEAQAYQTRDLLHAMEQDTGIFPAMLRVDGGLVNNRFVCQFLADLLHIPIELPRVTETTALGAAFLAGLQVGVYDSLHVLGRHWQRASLYQPEMPHAEAESLYREWRHYLGLVLNSG